MFYVNRNIKKVEVETLILNRTEFKTNSITKDKEGHYIMIKGSIKNRIQYSLIYIHPIQEHLNIYSTYLQTIREILTIIQ